MPFLPLLPSVEAVTANPLVAQLDLSAGSVSFPVPTGLPAGPGYAVVLFGDSSNLSEQFTILENASILPSSVPSV